ncbi:type I methionyl aminopeptidase [Anaerovorax odorimutans]|uniref:type I methionyl aminopeptidase n=1 Tax=Anaerovorax odorimutans TaxID=109327 RepID=UPI000402D397|nr:type I methionyl aminopeptidase [Anaerovorax odorimutans]
MIIIKSQQEIEIMREAGKVTGYILAELENYIKPGISTKDIDDFIENIILKYNMIPSFKGYNGFPASACVSVNEELVHGIPSKKRKLKEGDIVSVDTGATYKGYVSDAARTYAVGAISEEAQHLITATKDSFFEGLKFCKVGYRLSDISSAIQSKVESEGLSVVRDFVGHGIGRNMHEDPQIPNYGKPGKGPRLVPGMVFAIEPMVNQGSYEVEVTLDNWTVVTLDGKLSAHYENSVVITDGEPMMLTI